MSRTQVSDWFRRFKDGRNNVDIDESFGSPPPAELTKNIADVREAVWENRLLTSRELSEDGKDYLQFSSGHYDCRFRTEIRDCHVLYQNCFQLAKKILHSKI